MLQLTVIGSQGGQVGYVPDFNPYGLCLTHARGNKQSTHGPPLMNEFCRADFKIIKKAYNVHILAFHVHDFIPYQDQSINLIAFIVFLLAPFSLIIV